MPSVGRMYRLAIPVFTRSRSKSNTATAVVSLPVPAVVGTAIRGLSGPGGVAPRPSVGLTYSVNSAGHVAYRFAAFAVSIVEPPPTARNPSNLLLDAAAIASRNELSVGSQRMSLNTSKLRPADRSDSSAASPGYRSRTAGSTNTSTRRQRRSTNSAPTSRVAPEPNRTVDPVIWKIVSVLTSSRSSRRSTSR